MTSAIQGHGFESRTEVSLTTRTDDGMTNGAGNVTKLIQVHRAASVLYGYNLTMLMLVKK